MIRTVLLCLALVMGATAPARAFVFDGIDGTPIDLADWAGQPVLVVNTASRCGFTRQYETLQALYDRYRDRGLVVLAVPSDDFRQELASAEAVREFCEINFDLDLPMTDITRVTGPEAHPFYAAVAARTGFAPAWNFNKILIDGEGTVVATFGATTRPLSRPITERIEALLE